MKYEDYLVYAKELKNQVSAKEIVYRTSISRAYNYAYVFFTIRYSDDEKFDFHSRTDDNKKLVGELLRQAHQRELAEMWRKLCNDRNFAEYDMEDNFEKIDADEYVDDVEKFVADVKRDVKVKRRAV
jgi:hypothetical protein